MSSKLEKAEAHISDLETRNKALETDLNYYRGVARTLSSALDKMGVSVWVSNGQEHVLKSQIDATNEILKKGRHMGILEKAIQSDENVSNAWNKFMVTLRLCGFDNNDERPDAS
ncbi:hypothetical protein D3C87_1215570 [compost metagenome]